MKTDENQLKWRLKMRAKGRLRFSLEQGLFYGIMIFSLNSLMELNEQSVTELFFSLRAVAKLGLSILGFAVVYGTYFWWQNERYIKKLSESKY